MEPPRRRAVFVAFVCSCTTGGGGGATGTGTQGGTVADTGTASDGGAGTGSATGPGSSGGTGSTSGTGGRGDGPDWDAIKAQAVLEVALADVFAQPQRRPLATLGWEDGVFVSRDGLHLYAFYAPADVIQFATFFAQNPACPDVTPFLRGPDLGMDLTTNPWGCRNVLHSDIAHATRAGVDEPFGPWQRSNIANPYRWDGAFQALDNGDGTLDVVVSVSTDQAANDLYWARGVNHDPPFSAFEPLPPPINTPGQEDNPHLERLDAGTLVLLWDNDGVDDPMVEIQYAVSTDDGQTWSPPAPLGPTINAGPTTMTGHLVRDGADWWLYFASDRDGVLSVYRSRHDDSANIAAAFDAWGPSELVVAPGPAPAGVPGHVVGVGEPSLSDAGDLSVVVVYVADEGATEYDRFDADPWVLPRKP